MSNSPDGLVEIQRVCQYAVHECRTIVPAAEVVSPPGPCDPIGVGIKAVGACAYDRIVEIHVGVCDTQRDDDELSLGTQKTAGLVDEPDVRRSLETIEGTKRNNVRDRLGGKGYRPSVGADPVAANPGAVSKVHIKHLTAILAAHYFSPYTALRADVQHNTVRCEVTRLKPDHVPKGIPDSPGACVIVVRVVEI